MGQFISRLVSIEINEYQLDMSICMLGSHQTRAVYVRATCQVRPKNGWAWTIFWKNFNIWTGTTCPLS